MGGLKIGEGAFSNYPEAVCLRRVAVFTGPRTAACVWERKSLKAEESVQELAEIGSLHSERTPLINLPEPGKR